MSREILSSHELHTFRHILIVDILRLCSSLHVRLSDAEEDVEVWIRRRIKTLRLRQEVLGSLRTAIHARRILGKTRCRHQRHDDREEDFFHWWLVMFDFFILYFAKVLIINIIIK